MDGIMTMKVSSILNRELGNPEFAQYYYADKRKSIITLALYHARVADGLTQIELVERAGVPQATIARIETEGNITFDELSRIAHVLDIKLKFNNLS